MELLSTFHSWFRWLVLVALLGGALLGLVNAGKSRPWQDRPYVVATVVLDVQVATGLVLWIGRRAWETAGFFIGVLHPVAMLGAMALAHASVVLARRRDGRAAHLIAGIGMLLALGVVVAAIPRWAWF